MPDNALARGLDYHRAGHLHEAEQIYRQILQDDSDNIDAFCCLAGLCMAQGRFAEAASIFQQVIRLRPHQAEIHNDLGVAFAQQGKTAEALASFQQALALKSDYAEAHNNRGIVLAQQDRPDEAISHYAEALRLRPDYAEAHNNLGIVLARQRKLAEAVASYAQALCLRPDYAEAHNNLALALSEQGEMNAAVASYRQALRLRPDYAEAHYNLGVALAKMERLDEASACYQEALRLKPDYAEAYNNLGVARGIQGRLEESVASFRQALRLKPDYAEAYYNLGLVLIKEGMGHINEGKLEEAIACYRQALLFKPDYAEAHKDLALAWLMRGNFAQGWPEYEWRWLCPGTAVRPFTQQAWDGTALAGRTILLYAEQGLGDTLQFIRYAPLVQQRGGKVLVMCQQRLLALLASCPGIDRLAAWESVVPEFDLWAPLLSLPGILQTRLTTIPATVPYLFADPQLVCQWRQELQQVETSSSTEGELKIGIAWQGNPGHKQDRQRSIPLTLFAPLAGLPGVRLFSIQLGPGTEQLLNLGDHFAVTDLGNRFDPASFQDAAAVMMALDLIISVDSAMAHLAGALGVPVWVLLPYVPDWRWLLEREDSPWYPSMRLFRQRKPGNWEEVFERLVAALSQRFLGKDGNRS
jgi:tetratricopeptide (TPR) repeat protein